MFFRLLIFLLPFWLSALAPLIDFHLAGFLLLIISPSHPLLYVIGVHRTDIEEVLGVSHWLPHRSFAQSLGSLFMTASSPPHTLSCHSVDVAHENTKPLILAFVILLVLGLKGFMRPKIFQRFAAFILTVLSIYARKNHRQL